MGQDQLFLAQKSYHTIRNCCEMAVNVNDIYDLDTSYYWDDWVLMGVDGNLYILRRQIDK